LCGSHPGDGHSIVASSDARLFSMDSRDVYR
jgi:hypothetical protein